MEPTESEQKDMTLNKIDKLGEFQPPESERAQTPSDHHLTINEEEADRVAFGQESSRIAQPTESDDSDTNHEQIKDLYSKIVRKVQMKCKPSMDRMQQLNS